MTTEAWRTRLYEKLRADGRAMTAISQAAGLGVNYVEQLMKEDKAITVPVLLRLCDVIHVSPGYIFTGVDLGPDGERLLRLASDASPQRVRGLIDLLGG